MHSEFLPLLWTDSHDVCALTLFYRVQRWKPMILSRKTRHSPEGASEYNMALAKVSAK
jgi:hypothetical protein